MPLVWGTIRSLWRILDAERQEHVLVHLYGLSFVEQAQQSLYVCLRVLVGLASCYHALYGYLVVVLTPALLYGAAIFGLGYGAAHYGVFTAYGNQRLYGQGEELCVAATFHPHRHHGANRPRGGIIRLYLVGIVLRLRYYIALAGMKNGGMAP